MAGIVTKFAAKKLLGKQMNKYKDKNVAGKDDPFFTEVKGRNGKMKKVKKQVPDYIPEHDAIILAKMRQRAYWLDMSLFSFAGLRFGWSSVIGIIPGFGDAADAALAALLVWRCSQVECKLDSKTKMLMWINVFIDFLVGLVPFVGDLADAYIRANSKNLRLLEERLDKVYKPEARKVAEQKEPQYHPPATDYEYFDDDEEKLPMHRQDIEPQRPEAARVPAETRGGEKPSRKGTLKKSDSRRERNH